jgi:uncharacterized protein involved in propanediol utilization
MRATLFQQDHLLVQQQVNPLPALHLVGYGSDMCTRVLKVIEETIKTW